MQVRYVFDPDLQQARARLALRLIPLLAASCELKAEALAGSKVSEAWKPLYSQLSRPLPQPRVQIFHGPAALFKAHPLQWNVVVDPTEVPASADEVWVFSEEKARKLSQAGAPQVKVLPLAMGTLNPDLIDAAALPMDLKEPQVLFCSLPWSQQADLTAVLKAYLPAFCGQPETILALHLDSLEAEIETQLMSLVESLASETGVDLEKLNLETWIGPLEAGAYLALLQRSQVLLAPVDSLQALEALSLGKQVLGWADAQLGLQAELSPALLQNALKKPAPTQPEDRAADLVAAIAAQLARIEGEVDFSARAAAWQQAQEHARQGRKQKYSLFHSDYQEPEMQARRQWHLRYARFFEGVPGDVLDIGCGSGIFLEIMRDLGLPACGVDPDPDMVDVCRELGLQALPGDERELADWQPESLGGIHASHVIEHVDGSRAISLIENAFRTLRPGGKLLVRTPNWRNDTVRHEGFWLDITHIRPYPLPLLKQVFEDAGFAIEQMGFEEFGWNDTFIVGCKPGGSHG